MKPVNVEAAMRRAALSYRIARIRQLAHKTTDPREAEMLRKIADAYAQEDLPLKPLSVQTQKKLFE